MKSKHVIAEGNIAPLIGSAPNGLYSQTHWQGEFSYKGLGLEHQRMRLHSSSLIS